ncbi:hypothetical protein [Aquisphaera insulae]|uniref:hypothetical protein n=1 Tax=Aquisphaera insulae TaxID=2712864 RepID=UPI0013EB828C|nr:hypothetical protein [Aquisphaera insulae]
MSDKLAVLGSQAGRIWVRVLVVVCCIGIVGLMRMPFPGGRRSMQPVSLSELEKATLNEPFLLYRGQQAGFHRIQAASGRIFMVAASDLAIPGAPTAASRFALFVKFESGRMRPLTPHEASWITPGRIHGLAGVKNWDAASKDVETEDETLMPVLRKHGKGDPRVLLLDSDGDWFGDSLELLDGTLEQWVRDVLPRIEPQWCESDTERPRLVYHEAASAADGKTIVVRAEGFQDRWCESLAGWLKSRYPFLGQLETEVDDLEAPPSGDL